MKKNIISIICIAFCCVSTVVMANESNIAQKEYHKVTGMINWIKQNIINDQQQLSSLETKVREADNAINHMSLAINQTRSQFKIKKASLQSLSKSISQYHRDLGKQQATLNQHLRAIYALQQQNHLKMIINREDPSSMDRVLNYASILNQHYLNDLKKTETTLHKLQEAEHNAKMTKQQYIQLIGQQERQMQQLMTMQNSRKTIIHRLNKSIATNHDKLSMYQQDKARLGQVMQHLEENKQLDNQNFKGYYQQLSWPVRGPLLKRYGSALAEGKLALSGVIIGANLNTPVRAVAAGRVVFARWLKGFGLLVIINHGHGYMTLYGRNNSLYQHSGDWVKRGQQIGAVGQSGGFSQPSLYFAIRHNGQPLNPEEWCRR